MTPKKQAYQALANTMIKNFAKRNIEAFYCNTKEEAAALAMDIMKDGGSVGMGGSSTVKQTGLLDLIKDSDNLHFIDRSLATTPKEKKAVYLEMAAAEYFLMSSNAVTIEGELVNMDGNANRLACLLHGPDTVIVMVGMNKVVDDVESGIQRIGTHAAPPNAIRLGTGTPCGITGHCADCFAQRCMCSHLVVTRRSSHEGRIKVILIGEELGY